MVMMTYQYKCWKFEMMQLLSLWKYFLWIQSIRPCFLAGGKKLMWFLFIKKEEYIVNNYRPVSLLPIASKIFEKAIYHNLLNYIERENLLNINQSGFRANDSCINQLISITHEIYRAFNCNPSLEVRGIFLDLSKAFDKVWHQGLLFKLESFGIRGKLLNLLEDYLSNRFQRVLLNRQESSWFPVKAGVPQWSILGPLLFLIYINGLPDGLNSIAKLFADDTFFIVQDLNESAKYLNLDLSVILQWACQWKMLFNPDPKNPAQEVIFSRKKMKKAILVSFTTMLKFLVQILKSTWV